MVSPKKDKLWGYKTRPEGAQPLVFMAVAFISRRPGIMSTPRQWVLGRLQGSEVEASAEPPRPGWSLLTAARPSPRASPGQSAQETEAAGVTPHYPWGCPALGAQRGPRRTAATPPGRGSRIHGRTHVLGPCPVTPRTHPCSSVPSKALRQDPQAHNLNMVPLPKSLLTLKWPNSLLSSRSLGSQTGAESRGSRPTASSPASGTFLHPPLSGSASSSSQLWGSLFTAVLG